MMMSQVKITQRKTWMNERRIMVALYQQENAILRDPPVGVLISTTKLARIELRSKAILRGVIPATDRLSHGTPFFVVVVVLVVVVVNNNNYYYLYCRLNSI